MSHTLGQLRNLIRYNSPEIDKTEQEFGDHVGMKRPGH